MTSEVPNTDRTDSPRLPNIGVRYRCAQCGNLTRFDVVMTRTTRAYHHYSVGGELQIEDVEVLDEQIHEVSCRWCGTGKSVVELGVPGSSQAPGDAGTA